MTVRNTRSIFITLPGGRTSPDSVAHIIDTIFTKGLENGERIDAINAAFGSMSEVFTLEFVVSVPAEVAEQQLSRDLVDDRRR